MPNDLKTVKPTRRFERLEHALRVINSLVFFSMTWAAIYLAYPLFKRSFSDVNVTYFGVGVKLENITRFILTLVIAIVLQFAVSRTTWYKNILQKAIDRFCARIAFYFFRQALNKRHHPIISRMAVLASLT